MSHSIFHLASVWDLKSTSYTWINGQHWVDLEKWNSIFKINNQENCITTVISTSQVIQLYSSKILFDPLMWLRRLGNLENSIFFPIYYSRVCLKWDNSQIIFVFPHQLKGKILIFKLKFGPNKNIRRNSESTTSLHYPKKSIPILCSLFQAGVSSASFQGNKNLGSISVPNDKIWLNYS